jgi:hypothetical protein
MKFSILLSLGVALALCGCTTERETSPDRTATEQLLISTAAERAATKLALEMPAGSKIFVDATNFDGVDAKYAVAAIRAHLLEHGCLLMDDKGKAENIVEIRAGALSMDENSLLVGIPQMTLPIPLAGQLGTPEIALFKRERHQGLAKFAAVGYSVADGKMIASAGPEYGETYETHWVALLIIGWTTSDVGPEDDPDNPPSRN